MFNLKTRKQGYIVPIEFNSADIGRHDMAHELACLLVDAFSINQDFADLLMKVIANSSYYQTTFLVNQEGTTLILGGIFNGTPQLQQIIEIPLQLFFATANSGGAGDYTHARRDIQLRHHITQFRAVFTLNAPGNTSATWIIGHQNQMTACQ